MIKTIAGLRGARHAAFLVVACFHITAAAAPGSLSFGTSRTWQSYSPAVLLNSFPGLATLALKTDSIPTLLCLSRVLDQTSLRREDVARQDAPVQIELISRALRGYAESLLKSSSEDPGGEAGWGELFELQSRQHRLSDLISVAAALPSADREKMILRLRAAHTATNARMRERGEALIRRVTASLSDSHPPSWHGRTAVVELEGGHALALKFSRGESSLLDKEGSIMREVGGLGLSAPIPLPRADDRFTRPYDGDAPGRPAGIGKEFLPYLIPSWIARDYFSYLGDPLPASGGISRESRVETAALKAVDDMVLLFRNGKIHTSLAPISHSEVHWSWDYWRWTMPLSALKPRFGPSSIHNWKSALSYANLRLSGIADHEHIEPLSTFPAENSLLLSKSRASKPTRRQMMRLSWKGGWRAAAQKALQSKQYRQSGMNVVGQNITEWALLTMRAGIENGLEARKTSAILARGLRRHADNLLETGRYALDDALLERRLLSAVRRFNLFHAAASFLPDAAIRAINRIVGMTSMRPIAADASLAMPGWTVHPLIVDVVWPYTEALHGRVPIAWNQFSLKEGLASPSPPKFSSISMRMILKDSPLLMLIVGGFGLGILLHAQWPAALSASIAALRLAVDVGAVLRRRLGTAWIGRASPASPKGP